MGLADYGMIHIALKGYEALGVGQNKQQRQRAARLALAALVSAASDGSVGSVTPMLPAKIAPANQDIRETD